MDLNPDEFAAVSEIINIIGRWFYTDLHCVLLNAFLKKRFYKESDLVSLLKLPVKQVGHALWLLNEHQLLMKYITYRALLTIKDRFAPPLGALDVLPTKRSISG